MKELFFFNFLIWLFLLSLLIMIAAETANGISFTTTKTIISTIRATINHIAYDSHRQRSWLRHFKIQKLKNLQSSKQGVSSGGALPHSRDGYSQQFSSASFYFLPKAYQVKGEPQLLYRVRQVPGDGNCFFHAVAEWLHFISCGGNSNYQDYSIGFPEHLEELSFKIRQLAVKVFNDSLTLQEGTNVSAPLSLSCGLKTMILGGSDKADCATLLEMAGSHYNVTTKGYIEEMACPGTWGGGPEIVALANHLRCPILVYTLAPAASG